MRRTLLTLSLAVVTVFSPALRVRADLIRWSETSAINPRILFDQNSTGGIATTFQPWKTYTGTGTQSILGSVLMAFTSATPTHPDKLVNKPYKLTCTFQDRASGAKGTLLFSGLLNGTFCMDWYHITNTFVGPRTQRLHLGHYYYDVTIGPFSGFNAEGFATLKESVYVHHNPEPTSMVMAGLGLGLVGLVGWRRSRGRQNGQTA
jgi:hypothetical protein